MSHFYSSFFSRSIPLTLLSLTLLSSHFSYIHSFTINSISNNFHDSHDSNFHEPNLKNANVRNYYNGDDEEFGNFGEFGGFGVDVKEKKYDEEEKFEDFGDLGGFGVDRRKPYNPYPPDHDYAPNDRPIIGIFTQPSNGGLGPEVKPRWNLEKKMSKDRMESLEALKRIRDEGYDEYVASSYVKFLHMAGARVVAVRFNQTRSELQRMFRKLNGMFLPGGGTELVPGTPFFDAGAVLWDYVLKEDPNYPVFGTCLGFELLAALAVGNNDVLTKSSPFNATNVSWPLHLTPAAKDSRLFGAIWDNRRLHHALTHKNVTYNAHSEGITPEVFAEYSLLRDEFEVLAHGYDKDGKEFIAAMESKPLDQSKNPDKHANNVFAVQFHPEKPIFEWFVPVNVPHSYETIRIGQIIADAFVMRARYNTNSFNLSADEEMKVLIENHRRIWLGNQYFNEAYVFNTSEPQLGLNDAPLRFEPQHARGPRLKGRRVKDLNAMFENILS